MRIASRVIGAVLAVAGIGFIALPVYVYVLGQWGADLQSWVLAGVFVAVGIGCVFAGRSFLRMNVGAEDELPPQPSHSATPLYRRELKIVAQTGLVLSLIRLTAACFGVDWPGKG